MNSNITTTYPDGSLILMVGVPGSGKSTLAAEAFSKDSFIVSSDAIREIVLKNPKDNSQNSMIFDILHYVVKKALDNGYRVVCDATNLDHREELYALVDKEKIYAVVLATPLDRTQLQNKARDRVVPEQVIDSYYKRLFGVNSEREQYVFDAKLQKKVKKFPLEKESVYNQLFDELPKGHVITVVVPQDPSKKVQTQHLEKPLIKDDFEFKKNSTYDLLIFISEKLALIEFEKKGISEDKVDFDELKLKTSQIVTSLLSTDYFPHSKEGCSTIKAQCKDEI